MATHRRLAKVEDNDFYKTPAWASHALMVFERFEGSILEPCCGDGSISKKPYYIGFLQVLKL
jgi:hypothetical protein